MSRPLWYDEAFAVLFSAEGPRAMSYGTLVVDQGIAADVHPLGYYTLLWAWQAVAGGKPARGPGAFSRPGAGAGLFGIPTGSKAF